MHASHVGLDYRARPTTRPIRGCDPDWEFFLPDEDETLPEPGDFWLEPDEFED